jgi:FHA domain-containing protein/von Willebrand factor type A domain-containing protein
MRLPHRIVTALAGALIAGAGSAMGAPPADDDTPTLVVFAIDTSGSLRSSDLARAGELAGGILGDLPRGSEAALFTFDDQARLVVRRTARPEEIRSALAGLRPQGRHTALNDALYDATRYLRDADTARRALVLLTDGRDENSAVELGDGLAVAQQAGIPVFAVGVGRVEERVMRRVAKLTGGQYMPLREARPGMMAARITAFEGTAAPGGGVASPRPRQETALAGAARGRGQEAAVGETSPGTEPRRPGDRVGAPIWIAAALALLLAGVVVIRRRQRAVEAGRDSPDEKPAPTLLERMGSTEEFLEKTVTLRERPVLTITRGPGVGQVFELGNQAAVSIGRAKANEIVVDDVSVSSEHCRIRPEDGHFVLHDLKSTNGTFVNERRITRHVLAEGDVMKIGETSLLFKTDLKRT